MLLAHGLTDNGLCWTRVARALEADYDIVMLDARGHGESVRLHDGETHDPGQDIAEVIECLNLKSPILMGHSVGALAVAAFANSHPHIPAKVILEDPPFLPKSDPSVAHDRLKKFREQVARFHTMSDAEITDMGKSLSPDWHDDEFPAWTLGKRQVDPVAMPLSFPLWQTLINTISAPTLLLYGEVERGGLVTPEIAAEAVMINPGITAIQIEGAGHNIRRENFDAFLSAVRGFLHKNEGEICKT